MIDEFSVRVALAAHPEIGDAWAEGDRLWAENRQDPNTVKAWGIGNNLWTELFDGSYYDAYVIWCAFDPRAVKE